MATQPADLPSPGSTIALTPAPELPDLPGLGSSLALSFLSLGLVCLLAFVSLRWLSRRTMRPWGGPLRVLARQNLDPKRSVFVIEAAERCFLVGAGDGGMTLLAELDRATVQRELAEARAATLPPGRAFADVLARVLGGRGGR